MYQSNNKKKSEGTLDVKMQWTKDGVVVIGKLPPCLSRTETAELMGLRPDDLSGLYKHGLFYPSGHNPKKGRKPFSSVYYPTIEVLQKMGDAEWWDEARHAIAQYNKDLKRGKDKQG